MQDLMQMFVAQQEQMKQILLTIAGMNQSSSSSAWHGQPQLHQQQQQHHQQQDARQELGQN
eukprot:68611-Prorocentrum_lima.AAC.1